jgi:hypothetical protein
MARTLTFQNQIRATTSGIEFIDDLDLNQAQIIIDDDESLNDPAQVSGTVIYDLNFIRTALRDIKGDTPAFAWFNPISTTSGLISLADTRTELSNLQDYVGSSGDGDSAPTYSSTVFVTPTADLTEAIGQLDSALATVSGATPLEIQKRILIKTIGGVHPKNTSLNIDAPGSEWEISGDDIDIPDSGTFMESVSVYFNGALLLNGANSSANRDVYFVAANHEIAFEFNLNRRTVLQIWRFPST